MHFYWKGGFSSGPCLQGQRTRRSRAPSAGAGRGGETAPRGGSPPAGPRPRPSSQSAAGLCVVFHCKILLFLLHFPAPPLSLFSLDKLRPQAWRRGCRVDGWPGGEWGRAGGEPGRGRLEERPEAGGRGGTPCPGLSASRPAAPRAASPGGFRSFGALGACLPGGRVDLAGSEPSPALGEGSGPPGSEVGGRGPGTEAVLGRAFRPRRRAPRRAGCAARPRCAPFPRLLPRRRLRWRLWRALAQRSFADPGLPD